MTDKELAALVLDLKKKGYKPDARCWNLSVSHVGYECGENFSVMYVLESAPDILTRIYDLHPHENNNEEKAPIPSPGSVA